MDKLFTIKDVADLFHVSQRTIRRLLYDLNSPIPFKRIGRQIRFNKKDVLAYQHYKRPYSELNRSEKAMVSHYE